MEHTNTESKSVDNVVYIDDEMTLQKWKNIAEQLWELLDDVDTALDAFKQDKEQFCDYTIKKIAARFKLMGSDGHNIYPIKSE